jgi:alanine dehydrogenase
MIIGVPREIKTNENRVALVPAGAAALVADGHTVVVEAKAGQGSGFSDDLYQAVGARVEMSADAVWASADLIVKVKEPIEAEWHYLKPGQTIFTYFHFAASEKLLRAHVASGATCIAYETVELPSGELPLLTPMSEVAGRLAVQEGAKYLEKLYGGRGVLLSGVPGVPPATVVILGGGVVGSNAARIAAGMGASVRVLDLSVERLRYLADVMPVNVQTVYADPHALREQIGAADLVIGAVLVHGATTPRLIRRQDLKIMRPGAVIVDVSVDQGGCVETIHPTTHEQPTFVVDGIVHYGVANMPGGVPVTATRALTNATLPYIRRLATSGCIKALREDSALSKGLHVMDGKITHKRVAEAFGVAFHSSESMIGVS